MQTMRVAVLHEVERQLELPTAPVGVKSEAPKLTPEIVRAAFPEAAAF